MAGAAARLGLGGDALALAVAALDELRVPSGAPDALLRAAACVWVAGKYALGARAPGAAAVAATLPACGCGRAACGESADGGAGAGAAAACGTGAAAARARLLRAEREVLAALDFGAKAFRRPTPEAFLRPALLRLQRRARAEQAGLDALHNNAAAAADGAASQPCRHHHQQQQRPRSSLAASLSLLLAEQALLESQLLAFRPSVVAAACVAYAHVLAGAPLREDELATAAGCCVGAGAAAEVSAAADVLRAVHAAVGAAAAGGNPYACSLRWLRLDPGALLAPPVAAAGDARLAALSAARRAARHAGGGATAAQAAWRWLLPAAAPPLA